MDRQEFRHSGVIPRTVERGARSATRQLRRVEAAAQQTTARTRRLRRRVDRRVRNLGGHLMGLGYRLQGLGPDPDASDAVLVQRVRSELGPVTHGLDLPRVHVTVHDGHVQLDGRVSCALDVDTIVGATKQVAGVADVNADLIIGLRPGDSRPSEGAVGHTSAARRELLGVVRALDVGCESDVERLLGATLDRTLHLLPPAERQHVVGHLPDDVREVIGSPRLLPEEQRLATPDDLYRAVADRTGRTVGTTEPVVRAVFATLAELIPEEVHDVQAVLPTGLRALWNDPLDLHAGP